MSAAQATGDEHLAGHPHHVDRDGWPRGPWDAEPDRADWRTEAGYPAIALRHPSGHWCGYVAVPPGHPAYSRSWTSEDSYERDANGEVDYGRPKPNPVRDLDCHGGVTYAEKCAGHVCHVPAPGEPADVFWLGFDFAHSGDAAPSAWDLRRGWARWAEDGRTCYWGPQASVGAGMVKGVYRDLAYVRAECESVGRQLARLAEVGHG